VRRLSGNRRRTPPLTPSLLLPLRARRSCSLHGSRRMHCERQRTAAPPDCAFARDRSPPPRIAGGPASWQRTHARSAQRGAFALLSTQHGCHAGAPVPVGAARRGAWRSARTHCSVRQRLRAARGSGYTRVPEAAASAVCAPPQARCSPRTTGARCARNPRKSRPPARQMAEPLGPWLAPPNGAGAAAAPAVSRRRMLP
jgi:hypothetical protein